ncbi:Tn3 family transposase [Actinoplanes sp. NEAU-A11]|uniref:Tn3 family transposase n=1 Tax=Actinoplanes aureus TaxID=2792083 RepID=A0A931CIN6_9ACTN|nr:Tn3 family transposase [Actinoplanes aureus]
MYRTGPRARLPGPLPAGGALLTRRLNTELVTDMWDDLLGVAASVQGGHATAAMVVGKLCSAKRQQNALTGAIKKYGALRRTVYAARYFADETCERRIARQLDKGENLYALRWSLGTPARARCAGVNHEQQTEQMWCLTWPRTPLCAVRRSTTVWPSVRCARAASSLTMRFWPTSGPSTTRTCTSTAISTEWVPSSTPTGTGRCGCPVRTARVCVGADSSPGCLSPTGERSPRVVGLFRRRPGGGSRAGGRRVHEGADPGE